MWLREDQLGRDSRTTHRAVFSWSEMSGHEVGQSRKGQAQRTTAPAIKGASALSGVGLDGFKGLPTPKSCHLKLLKLACPEKGFFHLEAFLESTVNLKISWTPGMRGFLAPLHGVAHL